MARPAPSPGRSLEAEGDLRPREMTVLARIRLMACSGHFVHSSIPVPGAYLLVHAREVSMRLFTSLVATALLAAACGGTAAAPSPTTAPTTAPTVAPTPTPQLKFTFNADLKTTNEVPAIANAEASCSGRARSRSTRPRTARERSRRRPPGST